MKHNTASVVGLALKYHGRPTHSRTVEECSDTIFRCAPGGGVAVKRGSGGRRVTDLRLMPRWGAGGVDTDPGAPAEVGT